MILVGLSTFLSTAMVARMPNVNIAFKGEGRLWRKMEYLNVLLSK
jgi:hypothetical protein